MTERTNYGQWTALQSEYIPRVPPEAIPHGAIFPIPIIKQFMSDGMIVELGAGRGASAKTITEAGFAWTGLEINEEAVLDARSRGHASFHGDARNFWQSSLNLAAIARIENASGVLSQGLLANIVENYDIRNILRTADIFLRPGGYLFVAEPVRYDLADWLDQDAEYAGLSLEQWRRKWQTRYDLNDAAGLPRGVFAVAKPGPEKDALDWGQNPNAVQALINSDHLERLARHVNEDAIVAYARRQHLALKDRQHTLMFSRNGEPLPGVFLTFRKEYGLGTKRNMLLYEYSAWYRGMSLDERHGVQDDRRWRAHNDEDGYYREFWNRLRKNFPKSMQPPIEYTI